MSGDAFNVSVNNVPAKKQLKETVSPHKLALLVLIKEFCTKHKQVVQNRSAATRDEKTPKEDSKQQLRGFSINTLRFIQSPDVELKQLLRCIKNAMQPGFDEIFAGKLKDLCEQGVAGLLEFIQSLDVLMLEPILPGPVVQKSSVLGLFLRRMLLAFDKLSFSQVTKLYRNYTTYYETAFPVIKDSDASSEFMDICDSKSSPSTRNDTELEEVIGKGQASHKQAELFIAQQAALIQTNEKEAIPPAVLQSHIRDLLKDNPDLAEAHYLSYLNALRVKEYCGAVNHLYHCFDRNTLANNETKPAANPDDIGRSFRYAALNLAALHCRFGHKEEALAALREAITMAQETNDNICLQHALSWLYRLEKDRREILLERSITKTGDLNLSYLTSLGVQAFTQHKALLSAHPSQIFEFMMKSDILNCQHSILELMSNSYAQKAALWHMYGKSCMSNLVSQLLLHLNTSDPARKGLYHSGEGVCLALCNVSLMIAQEGELSHAVEIINYAKERFPTHNQHSHIWMLAEEIMTFNRALQQGDWAAASTCIQNMATINQSESMLRMAQLLLYRGDLRQASDLIFKLVDESQQKEEMPPEHHARVLILQAELQVLSSNHTAAVTPLNKCLSICQQHHLDYTSAIVIMHIANVQLLLQLPSQAVSVLAQVMVSILSYGSVYDRARAHLLYAKCTIAQIEKGFITDKKKEGLLSATRMLSNAIEDFSKVEAHQRVKDALYLQARLYHELDYREERNRCAAQFRQLDQNQDSTYQPLIELL